MHLSAMNNGRLFFETYVRRLDQVTVVDIGSQDVNGSLREVCPSNANYIGLDFQEAKGVDVLLTDPYSLPFDDESVDVIVSSSCFEHSEMFWLVFTEVLRILKPNGLLYLNVPSNGGFHQYPVDCWRFYPDAGEALVTWGKRCGFRPALLESYTSPQDLSIWNDFVAVFLKNESFVTEHPLRIASNNPHLENCRVWGKAEMFNKIAAPEDLRHISHLNKLLAKERQNIEAQTKHLVEVKDQMNLSLSQAEQRAKEALNESAIRSKAALDQSTKQSKAALDQVQNQLDQASSQNARLADEINKLRNSRSWRVTAPLRAIKRVIGGR